MIGLIVDKVRTRLGPEQRSFSPTTVRTWYHQPMSEVPLAPRRELCPMPAIRALHLAGWSGIRPHWTHWPHVLIHPGTTITKSSVDWGTGQKRFEEAWSARGFPASSWRITHRRALVGHGASASSANGQRRADRLAAIRARCQRLAARHSG